MWKIPFTNHFIKWCCMKVFCTYCFGCLISAFFSGVSIFSKFLLCFSYLPAYMSSLISLPLCFFCFFWSWFVQIFNLIGSLHIAKSDWLKLLPILMLCGGESQKPGNFKERTTLPYFLKSAITWETLSSIVD